MSLPGSHPPSGGALSNAEAGHLLANYGHSLPARAQRYHDWTYDPLGPIRSQISHLVHLAERWLVEEDGPKCLDRLVIDLCIRSLPPGAKRWASGNQPGSVNDLVKLLENNHVTQRLCGGTDRPSDADGRRRPKAPRPRPSVPQPTRLRPQWPAEAPPLRPRERSGGATSAARRATLHAIVPEQGTCLCPRPVRRTGEEELVSVPLAGLTREPYPQACPYGLGGKTPAPSSTQGAWSP